MGIRRIDCHMHTLHGHPERMGALADRFGYDKFNVLACPSMGDALNNLRCLAVKALNPGRAFAFCGLTYRRAGEGTHDFAGQLDGLLEAGFDGIKFIETKPTLMRELGMPLDSEALEPVFDRAEREGIPILWHVGDPATFWDVKKAPAFAVENRWCYTDPEDPSLASLYAQAEAVLARHPCLHVCFAHLYFCADDIAHARRVMDTWPNVRLDLTPGTEMYGHFLQDMAAWRAFFMAYGERILFGSDICDTFDAGELDIADHLTALIHGFLDSSAHFSVWDFSGNGMGLPEELLRKIYAENFEAFCAKTPRPLVHSGVLRVEKWVRALLEKRKNPAALDELDAVMRMVCGSSNL